MVSLVVFNSFNVVKNLKNPDLVARQKPPFYTAYYANLNSSIIFCLSSAEIYLSLVTSFFISFAVILSAISLPIKSPVASALF